MQQGVDETDAPLSDLEPVPASTAMWQPGHAAIFDIGRTTYCNTPSYLEQVRRTAPSSRSTHPLSAGAARYHPNWVSEGSNRLSVHVEKSSPPVLFSFQSLVAYTHVENNHQQETRQSDRQSATDIMFGWVRPDYPVTTANSQSHSSNTVSGPSSQVEN